MFFGSSRAPEPLCDHGRLRQRVRFILIRKRIFQLEICINIRRRSVTIREILQPQKYQEVRIKKASFSKFPKFGNNWRYISIYGGVLSLLVKFSRSKNIKFVNFPIFEKKKQKNMEDWKVARKNCRQFGKKALRYYFSQTFECYRNRYFWVWRISRIATKRHCISIHIFIIIPKLLDL